MGFKDLKRLGKLLKDGDKESRYVYGRDYSISVEDSKIIIDCKGDKELAGIMRKDLEHNIKLHLKIGGMIS